MKQTPYSVERLISFCADHTATFAKLAYEMDVVNYSCDEIVEETYRANGWDWDAAYEDFLCSSPNWAILIRQSGLLTPVEAISVATDSREVSNVG